MVDKALFKKLAAEHPSKHKLFSIFKRRIACVAVAVREVEKLMVSIIDTLKSKG